VTELNELYAFVGQKNEVYVVTAVDRATRCIVGHSIVPQRSFEVFQDVIDQGPRAEHYFSEGLAAYADIYYHEISHAAVLDKSQTSSVEGDNAELRHYLSVALEYALFFQESGSSAACRGFVCALSEFTSATPADFAALFGQLGRLYFSAGLASP